MNVATAPGNFGRNEVLIRLHGSCAGNQTPFLPVPPDCNHYFIEGDRSETCRGKEFQRVKQSPIPLSDKPIQSRHFASIMATKI